MLGLTTQSPAPVLSSLRPAPYGVSNMSDIPDVTPPDAGPLEWNVLPNTPGVSRQNVPLAIRLGRGGEPGT